MPAPLEPRRPAARRPKIALAALALAATLAGDAAAQSDWDLHMLRLVNRARLDPAGEAARIGSVVTDSSAPQPPLAYDLSAAQAASNHNDWMHANLGGVASGNTPDSFTHYETLDGSPTGAPATGSPSYTGATSGARLTATGFAWSAVGENIRTVISTNTIPLSQATLEGNHQGWWESAGHRSNMLNESFTTFGHAWESRAFAPPLGGIDAPFDNLHYATQNFGRPLSNPRTYALGLVYEDVDGSGDWTPLDASDPMREGLAGLAYTVYHAGTATQVASGSTMANGAFSIRLDDGTYDVDFDTPSGILAVSGFTVAGGNVDLGDLTPPTVAPPTSYCTAGTTTNGCSASISGAGTPSATAGSGFDVTITGVEGQKLGIIFYGVNGRAASPWGMSTSYLCVKAPTQRTPSRSSGGTAGACDGVMSLDWNAYVAATPSALGNPFSAGALVNVQGWFRDPPSPQTTHLSDALEFGVQP